MRIAQITLFFTLAASLSACTSQPDWQRAGATPLSDSQTTTAIDALTTIATGATGANDATGATDDLNSRKPRRWSGGVTAVAKTHPAIPNANLQLPRVSPDGKWIAFLDQDTSDPTSPPVTPDNFITGRNLQNVSLWIRKIHAPPTNQPHTAKPTPTPASTSTPTPTPITNPTSTTTTNPKLARNLAVGHAAWPAWSPDSKTLAFISHHPTTGCALVLHDVATHTSRRLAVGLRKMLTPAISPDGKRVAVVAYGQLPEQALVFIIDIESGKLTPTPSPKNSSARQPKTQIGAQISPLWLDNQTLLYIDLVTILEKKTPPTHSVEAGILNLWNINKNTANPISLLALPNSIYAAVHLHAGIPSPISSDHQSFAHYSPADDAIIVSALNDGSKNASFTRGSKLSEKHRAGTWWDDAWFLSANADKLVLRSRPQTTPQGDPPDLREDPEQQIQQSEPRTMTLLPGTWAPLWTDPDRKTMLIVGPDETSESTHRFKLLQLWVITR